MIYLEAEWRGCQPFLHSGAVVDTSPDSGDGQDVHWEERLLTVFDDLEQQAEGLALTARDAEVAELGRAEYAQLDLAARLHGSVGRRLGLTVLGVGRLEARLARVGSDWCLVQAEQHEWLVRTDAVAQVAGLGEHAIDARHRGLGSRLGFGSALRGVAEEGGEALVHLRDAGRVRGVMRRVGADFVEVVVGGADRDRDTRPSPSPELVAFTAIAAVRRA